MKELVSIIIPFYSNKEWLIECLDSVKNQSYKNYEIILINDGSKEYIEDICSDYSNLIYIKHKKNLGVSSARNTGILKSKGKYIAFLDSDDLWETNKLEEQLNFMRRNDYKWSHTSYKLFGKTKKNIRNTELQGNIFPACIFSNSIATPTVILEKDIILKDNYNFNTSIHEGEDTIFWTQIARKYSLGHLDKCLTLVRVRQNNASKDIIRQINSKKYFYNYLKSIKYKNKLDLFFLCLSSKLIIFNSKKIISVLYIGPYLYFKYKKKYYLRSSKN